MSRLSTLFRGAEHQPFVWEGGRPAAVLIHGFPGTPAEMRPIGEVLHRAGWTVHGVLLPGFGPEMGTLFERGRADWIGAVTGRVKALRDRHALIMLVGFSFGGAVALNAAVAERVDALVLAAPFWRLGGTRERVIWGVVKRLFPTFQPFRRMDFAMPQMRAGLGKMLPGVNLDDPEIQAELRALRVPARVVDEVAGMGVAAKRAAETVRVPTLIVQGRQDEVVFPKFTQALVETFPVRPEVMEVASGHEVLSAESPAWGEVAARVGTFAGGLTTEVVPTGGVE